MEVISPTKIGMPTLRTKILEKANTEATARDLDISNELLEATFVRITSYQQRAATSYNIYVKEHTFRVGDQVQRKVFENRVGPAIEKFQPN